jgi:hypothetical protein
MAENDIVTYVSLDWLDISKFPHVLILVHYTYAKNELSEHMGSVEMSINANHVKIRFCRKNCRLLAVFNMTLL